MARLNWGMGIALVYALFASATIGFAVFAMSSPVDLVSADYYARSLDQDRRMTAIANARALGDAVQVAFEPGSRALSIHVPAASRIDGTVLLYRPSNAAADRRLPFAPVEGVQTVNLADLANGRWTVQVEWTVDGTPYYIESSLSLP